MVEYALVEWRHNIAVTLRALSLRVALCGQIFGGAFTLVEKVSKSMQNRDNFSSSSSFRSACRRVKFRRNKAYPEIQREMCITLRKVEKMNHYCSQSKYQFNDTVCIANARGTRNIQLADTRSFSFVHLLLFASLQIHIIIVLSLRELWSWS